jgi:hypothetical protein
MGILEFGSNLLSRVRMLWGWFIKKSPAFIVLTTLTVLSIFGLGVGGTLAATGVIPNPLVAEVPAEPTEIESDSTYRTQGNGSLPPGFDGFDSLSDFLEQEICRDPDSDCWKEQTEKYNAIRDSGWTGVKINFIKGGYRLLIVAVPAPATYESPTFITATFSVNGVWRSTSNTCWNYGTWQKGDVCSGEEYSPIGSLGACLPGGDTYLIEVTGGGLNFRETGLIPAGSIDCPSPTPTTEPSPTPTTEPSPTPTTEPSPTPTTEPSPTATPEPSPTPTIP